MFNTMSVREMCQWAIEPTDDVKVWSCERGQTVYLGSYKDCATSDFADCTVQSFGIEDGILCINID